MNNMNKNNTAFFIDSNEELWFSKAEELNLKYISMPYILNDQTHDYFLGKGYDGHNFFETIRKGAMPTTSALNPQNYIDYFEPVFAEGKDIFYVHFSHKFSGTFAYMQTAIEELKIKYPDRKIVTYDSLSISIGAGMLVKDLGELFNNGKSVEEVIEFANQHKDKFIAFFTVADLNHLRRGGRLSAVSALVGGMLAIKPILSITKEGEIKKFGAVVGRKKSMQELINLLLKGMIENDNHDVYILHGDCIKDAEELKRMLLSVKPQLNVIIQIIGPTIGTHCGPDTLALAYYGNNR